MRDSKQHNGCNVKCRTIVQESTICLSVYGIRSVTHFPGLLQVNSEKAIELFFRH